jgi:alkanesulfonate monooxygenase SsuD/methylene tetrahydromethanopterin reductase-like flavin-dependent oxidoreductase (luciferase family)
MMTIGRWGAPEHDGDLFTRAELERIKRAVHNAETVSGLKFSVFVGVAEEDARAYAQRLHSVLEDPAHSVLVLCDPEFHALEIVTGIEARRWLGDVECGLAAAAMQTSFVAGDLVGGLATGIQQLGEAARHPKTLHTSQPG